MASAVPLSAEAYAVATLHAAAHPCQSVNGLLLGPLGAGAPSVTAALPLFHSHLNVPPLYEAALPQARRDAAPQPPLRALTPRQAEAYAAGKGLRLVGCYVAEERAAATEPPLHAQRLADALHASCPGAVLLLARAAVVRHRRARARADAAAQADGAAIAQREASAPPVAWRVRP